MLQLNTPALRRSWRSLTKLSFKSAKKWKLCVTCWEYKFGFVGMKI